MYQVKCIEKIRDKNNHIIEYKLIDNNKKTISVKPDDLKEAIKSEQLEVVNLTLTSDNRLIDNKTDTPSKPIINVESLLNRVKSIGYALNTFDTACDHKCYIASLPSNTKHIFIIPDDVKYIYKTNLDLYSNRLHEYMSNIKGMLRVIGGKGLIATKAMFNGCEAQSIDLTSLDTSKVTNMDGMFAACKAQSIDLSSFNTRNVTNMSHMFCKCKVQSLDLRSFDTSNVTNMSEMFWDCEAHSLDLRSFNTSNVTNMNDMFCNCKAQSIDLSSFNTSNVIGMASMFRGCIAQSIDLRSFDTRNVTDMYSMFYECKAQSINLSSFNTSNVLDMAAMFCLCKAQSLDLSSFDTSNVTNMTHVFSYCKAQIKVSDSKLKSQLQKDRNGG